LANQARAAGLLHDLGKYGELFQKRLAHPERYTGVDHWSAGAWAALAAYADKQKDAEGKITYHGKAVALAVAGHHLGLPWNDNLNPRVGEANPHKIPPRYAEFGSNKFNLSEEDLNLLRARFKVDGLRLPAKTNLEREAETLDATDAAAMLDNRMLFSCLVDADYLATEAHFQAPSATHAYQRPAGPLLQAQAWLDLVLAHIAAVAAAAPASDVVKNLRSDLLAACLNAATLPPGLFTLTAPTGSGKTLAMLAFALAHAQAHGQAHGLRRVVTVIPYLTIIEQTVKVYRQALAALGERCLDEVVLEDHSLAGDPGGKKKDKDRDKAGEDDADDPRRLLAENWDAPLVVTTSVRFFESLFANRPGACRKLHRLAGSVILLDEVQTLPVGLAEPTLAALDRLAERFGATVVMATATQPAFGHLEKQVEGLGGRGWQPREITSPELDLFGRVKRVRARWPGERETMSWAAVAQGMRAAPGGQALGVVNLKRHAISLYQALQGLAGDGVLHLSTNLCPAHREAVLAEVQRRLEAGEPCLLVSTQCIEAGVDLDMPVVWRAWGPLEAMAQAAGRCNRGGRRERGELVVFVPEEEKYPDGGYGQAAGVAETIWRQVGRELDLDDPAVFTCYYRLLYNLRGQRLTGDDLWNAIRGENYPLVAELYRIIDQPAVNVLVPYKPPDRPGLFAELEKEARAEGFTLNRAWLRRARRLAVSLFPPHGDDPLAGWLEPLPAGRGRTAEDWFILRGGLEGGIYHQELGLLPPRGEPDLIG
jgi:CRISPR-associated endonuclease Cas3-HD